MSFLSRIYVWSVVFEPLMFFVLSDRSLSGLSGSVSRLLQVVVVIGLALKILSVAVGQNSAKRLTTPSIVHPLYRNFSIYMFLAILAGMTGVVTGAYDLSITDEYNSEGTEFSRFVNGAAIRPLVEYFVAVYYFIYFAILPTYLLRRRKDVGYFLSVFKTAVVCSGVVGFVSLGLGFFDIEILPRALADGRVIGDNRFHGLFGEPRNAFVAVFLGLAMCHLGAYQKGIGLSKGWIVAAITAAIATQSASGLVGLLCFTGLYILYSLGRLGVRSSLRLVGVVLSVILIIIGAFNNSGRLDTYLAAVPGLWNALENEETLPAHLELQKDDIYPLYDLILKWRNHDILPLVLGSGFGSASVTNNRLSLLSEGDRSGYALNEGVGVRNPHSQLVRTIYESGLIGLCFFIWAFVWPVSYLTRHLQPRLRHQFIIFSLLVLGVTLGYRSAAVFIYFGAVLAMFRSSQAAVE